MPKIVLISCVSMKLDIKSKAKSMYVSPLFKYNMKYAQSMNPQKIFILSAKHGLLGLNDEILPYNETLNNMKKNEIEKWAGNVLTQLRSKTDLDNDEFIFLAGEKYRKFLIHYIKNYSVPMKGLGIGRQLKYLKEHTK